MNWEPAEGGSCSTFEYSVLEFIWMGPKNIRSFGLDSDKVPCEYGAHAIAQTLTRRRPIVAVGIRSKVNSCGICGEQSGRG
jgi:hypothetical protein